MIYPMSKDPLREEFNRYELAIAAAKCARMITDEYVRQRAAAEKMLLGNKDISHPVTSYIDSELRDEKAVKIAMDRLHRGDYIVYHDIRKER